MSKWPEQACKPICPDLNSGCKRKAWAEGHWVCQQPWWSTSSDPALWAQVSGSLETAAGWIKVLILWEKGPRKQSLHCPHQEENEHSKHEFTAEGSSRKSSPLQLPLRSGCNSWRLPRWRRWGGAGCQLNSAEVPGGKNKANQWVGRSTPGS